MKRRPTTIRFVSLLQLMALFVSMAFLSFSCSSGSEMHSAAPANPYAEVDSFAFWNKELSENPKNVEVLTARAKRYTREGAFGEALNDYETIERQGIPHFTVLLDKAALLSRLGRFAEATRAYERALAGAPDKSMLMNAKGLEASANGDIQLAISRFDSAIQSNPRLTTAWYNKGSLLFRAGEFEDAEFNFQKALQLEKGHGEALAGLGAIFWYVKEDKEGARWYYEQAAKGSSGQDAGWLGLGNLDMDAGRVESAIFNYQKSISLNPYQPDAWANKGLAYFQKKDYKAAEESYSKAIELNPAHGQALAMRGLIRCETGNIQAGCEDLNHALAAGMPSAAKEIERWCN